MFQVNNESISGIDTSINNTRSRTMLIALSSNGKRKCSEIKSTSNNAQFLKDVVFLIISFTESTTVLLAIWRDSKNFVILILPVLVPSLSAILVLAPPASIPSTPISVGPDNTTTYEYYIN